ncbi:hypothetical protein KOI35_37035 [Actinoplanes bogorensis]|uniref:Uncharacterized protein n=1 Tax=Paractinoplanes bogorensis TaxID=1610840 RepID=A0ABS5Z0B7_9ACTN|nr:hypothetical protein [Actinoplanes bogorensis]MBU2669133.1 hypothetical protein [Actinoplanes bogorensis]
MVERVQGRGLLGWTLGVLALAVVIRGVAAVSSMFVAGPVLGPISIVLWFFLGPIAVVVEIMAALAVVNAGVVVAGMVALGRPGSVRAARYLAVFIVVDSVFYMITTIVMTPAAYGNEMVVMVVANAGLVLAALGLLRSARAVSPSS